MNQSDFVDRAIQHLMSEGYQVHTGEDEDHPELGMNTWWFTWCSGSSGIKVGDTFATDTEAWSDALLHFFTWAEIPLDMEPS